MAELLLNQIVTMFIILVIGVIGYKTGVITKAGNKELSSLLLMVVNPIMIALSFQREFEVQLLKELLTVLAFALGSYLIFIFGAALLVSKKNKEYAVERFSIIFANAGFFGIPLVKSVFGLDGVFYLSSYLMMFNLCAWTYGVYLMHEGDKLDLKETARNFINPNIIAVLLGFILFLLGIRLPEQLDKGLNYIGDMNTALAMIIAGATLAQSDIKSIVSEKRTYYISFIRLIVMPLIIIAALKPFQLSDVVRSVLVITAACPTSTTGVMFALRFEKNVEYISSIYIMTTLVSIITIPLIMLFV